MKRTDAILLMAREIQEQRDKKSAAEAELRRINEALRSLLARFNELVPNGDEQVENGQLPAASSPVATTRRMADEILDVMRTRPEHTWHVDEVAKAMPGKNGPTVRSTMARMFEAKTLERPSHGRYRLAGATAEAPLPEEATTPWSEPAGEEVKNDEPR